MWVIQHCIFVVERVIENNAVICLRTTFIYEMIRHLKKRNITGIYIEPQRNTTYTI